MSVHNITMPLIYKTDESTCPTNKEIKFNFKTIYVTV